jgi:hypothetical protein
MQHPIDRLEIDDTVNIVVVSVRILELARKKNHSFYRRISDSQKVPREPVQGEQSRGTHLREVKVSLQH